jgi:16S rRNA (cytosine967-C5)-methyltransferase
MREGRVQQQPGSGALVRARALGALERVDSGVLGSQQALQWAMDGEGGALPVVVDPRDRALCTELVYGTLRRQRALDAWLARSCQRGLVGIDRSALLALRLGAYQLTALRIPPFAAVHATVDALRLASPSRSRAAPETGFVHAVLRKLAGRVEAADLPDSADLPPWIAAHSDALAEGLGLDAVALREAWSAAAPLHIHAIHPHALDSLQHEGLLVARLDVPATAIAHAAVLGHPGLARQFLIQDVASAAVTAVAAVAAGSRVLEIAAGRGVKSVALAAAGAHVTALDQSAAKLAEAARLCQGAGHPLDACVAADATAPLSLPADSFDTVLVDAPCSALGTLRRRPEVRHRRRAADVVAMALKQRAIAQQAARLVRRGGTLVLATCSISDAEGPLWLDDFLLANSGFEIDPCPHPWALPWRDRRGCLRTHPLWLGADGFFIARLHRVR